MRKCVKCKIQKHRISQCLWTKNRGKVTAFRDAELVFSPLSLSYKLSLFLLIADFKMRTSWMQMRDARRCGKLTDYTDCSKSGAVCPKRFSKELFSFGKSWTGNARPCDILSGQIGKTLLPLSQNSLWLGRDCHRNNAMMRTKITITNTLHEWWKYKKQRHFHKFKDQVNLVTNFPLWPSWTRLLL